MASNVTKLRNLKNRDRSARSLQLGEEDLGRLVECIADGIIILQDNRVVYANPSALAQFGAESLAELVGHKILDLVAPDDRLTMKAFNHQLFAKEGPAGRQKFRRRQLDGTLIEVETIAVRINWKGRPALLGVARNASQHEQMRMALAESEVRYRRVIEAAPTSIYIHQHGRITFANPAAAKIFGAAAPSHLLGREVLDLVAPECHARTKARIETIYSGRDIAEGATFRMVRIDGSLFDAEIAGVRIMERGSPAIMAIARDVTESRRIQKALSESEARLEGFLFTAAHWLWETDAEHRFTFLSESRSDPGHAKRQVLGSTRWELAGVSADSNASWREHVADLNARRPFYDFEFQSTLPNGNELHRSVSGIPVFNAGGVFQGYRGTSRDITERKMAERTIERIALHDALTKLPNRVHFTSELERAFIAAQRDGTKLAVLFLDLDHFKDINDTLGHSVGDKLLIEVANRLKSVLRGGDLVARFGGDEFVIAVTQPCDSVSISYLADRITTAIDEPYDVNGLTFHINISIGVAIYPDDALDTERILANADLALYTAKRAGRHTWRAFDCSLRKQLEAQRSLDQELRHGLDGHQFELHYQPLINIADDHINSFEALIRWNHPKHGQLLPDAFISATEQNRLIVPLTEWVLQEAATQLLRWASAGLGEHKVAVNISPILLRLQGFIDLFDRCMTRTRCDPRNLVIEITEGTLVDEAKAIPVLTALQKQGVTTAIDDFGMGYSSMVRLKTLPVDVLKVDRSFLANVTEDVSDASIVESLVSVGHSLGKKVVAEGVETVEQLSFLKSAGCDVAQGFFINRPMPAADIVPWLEQWQLPELCCVNRQDLCLSKT